MPSSNELELQQRALNQAEAAPTRVLYYYLSVSTDGAS